MIGYYDYTVIATYISLLSSFLGIFAALSGHPLIAVICLMLSGFFDMFDGRIALTKKDRSHNQKRFGIQIDSMCDLICFGLLPCIIGYSIGMENIFFVLIMFCYLLCAVIRLSYFNVDEEERQDSTTEKRKFYTGLPVTLAAIIFPCVYITKNFFPEIFTYIYAVVMALVAIAFVSPFKIKKPGKKELYFVLGIGCVIFAILMIITRFYAGKNA